MSFQGVDIRQTGDRILFRAYLQDLYGNDLATGTANVRVYELQSDGTLKSYDWSSNTFKTGALTTENQALTHRTGNNGTTNTGLWSFALATLTGFTAGNIYIAKVIHSTGVAQEREFQFGVSAAFDPYDAVRGGLTALPNAVAGAVNGLPLSFDAAGRTDIIQAAADKVSASVVPGAPTAGTLGEAFFWLLSRMGRRGTAQAGAANTMTLDAGASVIDNLYRGHEVKITSGTGSGQHATILSYNGTTKVATIGRKGDPALGWDTIVDNTSVFMTTPQPLANLGLWTGTLAVLTNGLPSTNVASWISTTLTESAVGRWAAGFKKFFDVAAPTSTMELIAGTTNAPTVGDLTAAMKASVTAAVPTAAQIRAEIDSNSTQLSLIVTTLNNFQNLSSFANIFGPVILEIPDAGTALYPFRFVFKDEDGHLVDVDGNALTLSAKNSAGVDRSANWSAVTHEGTGSYTANYSVSSAATKEGLLFGGTATVAGAARRADFGCSVEDYDTVTMLNSIYTKVANIPADPTSETNAATRQNALLALIGVPGTTLAADILSRLAAASYTAPLSAVGTRTALGMALANLDSQLSGISNKTINLPADPSSAATLAASFTSVLNAIAALPNSGAIVTAIFGHLLSAAYGGITFEVALECILSLLAGPSTGAETNTETFKKWVGGVDRIRVTNTGADTDRATVTVL
jgi:hypothetical protein